MITIEIKENMCNINIIHNNFIDNMNNNINIIYLNMFSFTDTSMSIKFIRII